MVKKDKTAVPAHTVKEEKLSVVVIASGMDTMYSVSPVAGMATTLSLAGRHPR